MSIETKSHLHVRILLKITLFQKRLEDEELLKARLGELEEERKVT